jgi:hypothetical protein
VVRYALKSPLSGAMVSTTALGGSVTIPDGVEEGGSGVCGSAQTVGNEAGVVSKRMSILARLVGTRRTVGEEGDSVGDVGGSAGEVVAVGKYETNVVGEAVGVGVSKAGVCVCDGEWLRGGSGKADSCCNVRAYSAAS